MAVNYQLRSKNGNHSIHIRQPNGSGVIASTIVPNIRCPHCMHMGSFSVVTQHDFFVDHVVAEPGKAVVNMGRSTIGIRACPNAECRGLVLAVMGHGGVVALPNEVLDFDPKDVPLSISSSLGEAVKCHSSGCYKAAALMVRRTLEELCEDRGAAGKTLQERIQSLSKAIIISPDLIAAADHLRLLGNDAAHIEARVYQAIGEEEARVAVELTKELLKAAYQYKSLLNQLVKLKIP